MLRGTETPRNPFQRFIATGTCTAPWVITTVHRLPKEIQSIHCGMSCHKPVSLSRREQWSIDRNLMLNQMESSVFLISNCTRLLSVLPSHSWRHIDQHRAEIMEINWLLLFFISMSIIVDTITIFCDVSACCGALFPTFQKIVEHSFSGSSSPKLAFYFELKSKVENLVSYIILQRKEKNINTEQAGIYTPAKMWRFSDNECTTWRSFGKWLTNTWS